MFLLQLDLLQTKLAGSRPRRSNCDHLDKAVMKLVKILRQTRRLALILFVIGAIAQTLNAQTTEPQRDELLNGLRVLLWNKPGDQTVILKLRIHSGAAFDTAGKAGTMALLGDLLFPDAATHDYFTGEMAGRLDVETDYDSIEITLQGRANEYDRIVDILRGALVTTPLTPENLAKVRETRIKKLSEKKPTAGEIADQAIAGRVLGDFPYTHPVGGTVESLTRIERPDVMLARDRFLSPNNATLSIVGGVDQRRAMRTLRQLLGGWRKSDQIVPATFRQPDPPDKRTLILNSTGLPLAEVRLGTRGIARADRDFFAASLLTVLARERWRQLAQAPSGTTFFAKADAHVLPEMFVLGATVDSTAALKSLETAVAAIKSLVNTPASPAELQLAKGQSFGFANQGTDTTAWLDIDTFRLPPISEQQRSINALSAADLQRVAKRLFNDNSIASVIVGNVEQLKAGSAAGKMQLVTNSTPYQSKPSEPSASTGSNTESKTPAPASIAPPLKNGSTAIVPD